MEIPLSKPRKLDPRSFIVPPDWAVRLVSTNFGKKVPKYPTHWHTVVHSYPGMQDDYAGGYSPGYAPWGMMDHSGVDSEERWRRIERERDLREHKIAVRGNLREEQYRFWNGSSSSNTEIATCRWCRHWAYGQEAVQTHQSRTDHTRILREIFDLARKLPVRMCFTCGRNTRQERWGIPLCATNRCLNKWRVAPIVEVSSTLLLYARMARARGNLKEWLNEDGSEKSNTEANPKQFNWHSASAY